MENNNHNYGVIIAGGSGTRLWPMSRKHAPKQFQALLGSQTMIQLMFELLREVLPPEHIFVQTDKRFTSVVKEQLPELPHENVLIEPEARDTGPAIAFAAATISNRDPEAKMAVFWSDHVINNRKNFVQALTTAMQAVEDFPGHVVSIGIKPTQPHTGLGYIQMKSEAKSYADGEVYWVDRFIEKPDYETAEQFVKSWEYLWNTGYSVFNVKDFFALMKRVQPEIEPTLVELKTILAQPESEDRDLKVTEIFTSIPKKSIDYMLMEKLDDLMVVPADLDWSDIGDWQSLHEILAESKGHHMITKGNHVGIDCEGCLVYGGERLIATMGIKDLVIVDTGDAILIANKNRARDMKKLVELMEQHDKHVYL